MMGAGYLIAAANQTVGGIGVATVLLGGGWAFLHSSLQTWATAVVPEARGTAVGLFVAALFIGSATGSALGAPLAAHALYRELFGFAALATVPLTLVASLARHRYRPADPGSPARS
jgi:predicted MFS family arabinose efflux permease